MFVSKKKYEELRQFAKNTQQDNYKLMSDNKVLRSEIIALRTRLEAWEKNYGKK